jgi:phospholipase C
MFANSATSYGSCINTNFSEIIVGYPQRTIFEEVDKSNKTWRVYFHDLASQWYFRYVRDLKNLMKFHPWSAFLEDCKTGNLPDLTWLEPRYFEDFGKPASDQHPSHDVTEGEKLMKQTYEALRASPIWNDSLLVITYDEHGGFYDHYPTPMNNVPNPDGFVCPDTHPHFEFKRLGVRIPTIAISPWINKGTLVHDPTGPTADSKYDHTSTLATIKKLWNMPNFLTKRDAWAGTFEGILQQRTTPRTDCPTKLPNPPSLRKLPLEGTRPLSDLQESFINMAKTLLPENDIKELKHPETEGEGRLFAAQIMSKLLNRPIEELLAV